MEYPSNVFLFSKYIIYGFIIVLDQNNNQPILILVIHVTHSRGGVNGCEIKKVRNLKYNFKIDIQIE